MFLLIALVCIIYIRDQIFGLYSVKLCLDGIWRLISSAQSLISEYVAPVKNVAAHTKRLLRPMFLWSGHDGHSPECPFKHVQCTLAGVAIRFSSIATPHREQVLRSSIRLASSTSHFLPAHPLVMQLPESETEADPDPGLEGVESQRGTKSSSARSTSISPKLQWSHLP